MVLVAVPLLFELIFIGTLTYQLHQVEKEREREAHAREISRCFNRLLEMGMFAIVRSQIRESFANMDAEKQKDHLAESDKLQKKVLQEAQSLRSLVSDDPASTAAVDRISKLMSLGEEQLHDIKWAGREQGPDAGDKLTQMVDSFAKLAKEARAISKGMHEIETLEKGSERTQAKLRRAVELTVLVGVFFNIALAMWLAVYFNRGTVNRLAVLMDNTRRLADGRPLNPPLAGGDEIAHLDSVFAETVQALKDAEERKQELMAMVTHDLRAPLTSVRWILSMLGMGHYGEVSPAAAAKLEVADRNLDRLITLINDLLTIDKLKSGKLDLNVDIIDLGAVIKRSADAVKGLAEPRHINIEVPQTNVQVLADSDRLVQVLINILSNALKYSPEHSTVTVAVKEEPTVTRVSIIDQGPGIPKEYLSKVFERFEQVKGDEIAKKKGTGLGLAICKAIVEQHGGMIGVDSVLGEGATFWFTIPNEAD